MPFFKSAWADPAKFGERTALLIMAALVVFLPGCAVGPNYRAPKTPAPAAFANAPGVATTNGVFNQTWWRTFNDPLLERLIAQASTNNYDLLRAQARLREARALWTEARVAFPPTVRNENHYDKIQVSKDVQGPRSRRGELYRTGFDATWELDLWGAVRRNVEAA